MYENVKLVKTKEGLLAPKGYVKAPRAFIEELVNGCGPAGWKVDMVPDTIYGLSVTEACNIHDWMYEYGETFEDKEIADQTMLDNINILIDNVENPWFIIKKLRRRRAQTMFFFVTEYGDGPFEDKEKRIKTV